MKWALLILGAAGAIGSAGCCWRQQPTYGAYPAQTYAPAYAPAYPPMQAAPCMPVQQAPACTCY